MPPGFDFYFGMDNFRLDFYVEFLCRFYLPQYLVSVFPILIAKVEVKIFPVTDKGCASMYNTTLI
jgi:hypothetical protein